MRNLTLSFYLKLDPRYWNVDLHAYRTTSLAIAAFYVGPFAFLVGCEA